MPTSLVVNEGGLLLDTADTLYDLSDVTFAAGAKVKIGALGITLASCDSSIASATFDVAAGFIPSSGATVLTCADSTVLAQAQTGLNASLASVGITVEVDGNSLVAESHYTFNSSVVTDMNDVAGWVNNLAAPDGQPAIISGSDTEAVMNYAVPAYSAISVTDGATLTVAATRDFPELMLSAGTKLKVSPMSGTLLQSYDTCIPHSHAVVVGTMDPSASITTLSDFSAKTAGTSFKSGSDVTSILAKSVDGGQTLLVQFKKHDDGHVKCAIVKFWQTEGTVYAQLDAAQFWTTSADNVGWDFVNADGTYNRTDTHEAETDSSKGYSIKQLSFTAPVAGLPSRVTATGDFVTAGSGSVTVDVAADCVLDLSGVDVATEATLVKTGDGAIVFGDELPAGLNVLSGVLAVQPYAAYDMTGVVIGNNAAVKVIVDGGLNPCVPTQGQNGTTIYMSGDTYIGVGGWNELASWASGSLPDASAAVHIYGGDTVLVLDVVPEVRPASISVEGGATLKVLADIELPPLAIDAKSKVVFGDNETQPKISATLDASLTTRCDAAISPVALSVFEISTNATVTVAGGMKFKNVDFRLYGTITKSGNDEVTPVFGYAENGETSYIAFTADGGVFDFHSDQSGDCASVSVVCPASGGTVIPVRDILMRNASRPVTGWKDFGRWEYGRRNPIDISFNVVADGTHMDCAAEFYASGAVHIALVNGARIQRQSDCLGHGFSMALQDAATVSVGDGCSITFTTSDGYFAVDSQSAVDTVVVHNGGRYTVTYNTSGYERGTFVSDGGIVGVDKLRRRAGSPNPLARSRLLRGFGSVRLDGDLSILSCNSGSGTVDWDRHVTMSDIPFAGAGGVTVTNGVPAYPFTVTMVNGANTATGSIKVAKIVGDAETTLYFADGANWAGTVVAGNVALTNLTEGATAASVDFAKMDLAADFPVRVWRGEDGELLSDRLNVGEYLDSEGKGGRVVPVLMFEGGFLPRDKFVLGRILKGADLPALGRGWTAATEEIEGDEDHLEVVLKRQSGLAVTVR